jgi:anti-sigma factor RsiW
MPSCDAIRELLPAYHEGDLPLEERGRVEGHLAACRGCSREVSLLREALQRIRTWPDPEPPEEFWEAFGAGVHQRIATERPPRPSLWARVADWLGSFSLFRPVPAVAGATALALLLAIGLARTERRSRELPPVDALATSEDVRIAQDLEVLRQLDVLEEVEVLEWLPILRRLNGGRRIPPG